LLIFEGGISLERLSGFIRIGFFALLCSSFPKRKVLKLPFRIVPKSSSSGKTRSRFGRNPVKTSLGFLNFLPSFSEKRFPEGKFPIRKGRKLFL